MSNLTNTIEIVCRSTGEVRYFGNLQNFRVTIWPCRILLTGSLPKFHLGSNIETIPREETARAIEHLSDALAQQMAEARVFRVDVGQTFAMERRPSDYWSCLVAPTRMKRMEFGNETLTFANSLRSVVFYDKRAEMRHRRAGTNGRADHNGASRFHGYPHLLRYEVQFKRRLGREFGEHEIRAASLSNLVFYEKLVGRWQSMYFELERVFPVRLPIGGKEVKSDVNFLAALGLQAFGTQHYLDAIGADLRAGLINKYQAHRRRKKIKGLSALRGTTAAADVLEELDTKVKQAAALCR